MGQRPDQIETEIEELRHETDLILDELSRRTNPQNILRAASSRVADSAETILSEAELLVNEAVTEGPAIARRNPFLVSGAALSATAALGIYALSSALLGRRAGMAERELDGRPVPGELGEEFDEAVARVMERAKTERGRVVIQRSEPNMLKRALWIALASGMAALGSMLFRRITARLWQSTMHEEPPRR